MELKRNNDILSAKDELDAAVIARGDHIYSIAKSVAESLIEKETNFTEELIPHISEIYGHSVSFYKHLKVDYLDNPHYDPSAPEDEEYIKLEKGFSSIRKETNLVGLTISENPDPYEDYGTTSWHIDLEPELALSGTDKELNDFLVGYFSDKIAVSNKRGMINDIHAIMSMDRNLIEKVLASPLYNDSKTDYTVRDKLIMSIVEE